MEKKLIIALFACGLLVAGCKNKKPIATPPAPEPEPVVQTDTAIPAPIEPIEPIETVEPVQPVFPIPEPVDTLEPIAAPEPEDILWQPQYETAYGKGMVLITYKQRQISSPVVVTYIADSIIVGSVQPMLGIEMYRLEARPEYARLFEKLNRRYVEMTYEEISAETKRTVDFRYIERMLEEVGLTYAVGQDTTISYKGVTANIRLQQRTVNQRVNAAPISTYSYSQVTLKTLLNK